MRLVRPGFWRGRKIALVSMAALFIALICFAAQSLVDLNRWHEQQLLSLRVGTWFTLQAQAHFGRLMVKLDRYADGDPAVTRDDLLLQFELFWSRVDVFGFEEAAYLFLGSDGVRDFVDSSRSTLKEVEPKIEALRSGDRNGADIVRGELNRIGWNLSALSLKININRVNSLQSNDEMSARLFTRLSLGLAATVFTGFILALLLLNAMRRQRQHLEAAIAAENRTAAAEADLRAVIDSLPAVISATDGQGRYLFVNRFFSRFFGIPPEQTIGNTHPPVQLLVDQGVESRSAADGVPTYREMTAINCEGESRLLLTTDVIILGDDDQIDRTVRIGLDITERKRAEDRVRYLAERDALTGVPNRAKLITLLDQQLQAKPQPLLALMVVDLDDFKGVNETLGHAIGDALLTAWAQRLTEFAGRQGLVCRLGGDEFGVVVMGSRSEEILLTRADSLQRILAQPFTIMDNKVRVSASIGVAPSSADTPTAAELLRHADIALRSAKERGRGRAAFFTASLAAQHLHRKRLEADLHAALVNGELRLEYQPKFELASRRLIGFEALLRWDHATLGPVSPSVFIPIAEEIGLIGALGTWVIKEVVRQLTAWDNAQCGLPVKLAVNLSAAQFIHGDIVGATIEVLNKAGIKSERLTIEITESILMRDAARATRALTRFREHGIGVAIDDFGTGFSSLSYLVQFPFDELKIDRNFVRTMLHSPAARAVVRSVIDLARSLDAVVVAEGIENDRQLAALLEMGCRFGQGFYLSEPLVPEAAQALMAKSAPALT